MDRFGSQKQRTCARCGVEPTSILGGVCSPCAAQQAEDDRALRVREVEALERIAAALEGGRTLGARIDAEDPFGNVLAYERRAARSGTRRVVRGKS